MAKDKKLKEEVYREKQKSTKAQIDQINRGQFGPSKRT
jgi:hypothetical protein